MCQTFDSQDAFVRDILPKARWHEWALNFLHSDPTGTCQMMLASKDLFKTICIRAAEKNLPLTEIYQKTFGEGVKNIRSKAERFEENYTPKADGSAPKEFKEKETTKKIEDSSWNKLQPEAFATFAEIRDGLASAKTNEDLSKLFVASCRLLEPVYEKLRKLQVPTKDINGEDRVFTYEDYRTAKVFYVKTIGLNAKLILGHEKELQDLLVREGIKCPSTIHKMG